MMAQSRAESTRDKYNYGQFITQFPPNTIKVMGEFERIQKKICRHKMSIMFNEICIYIYIYIYIYKHFLVYLCMHILLYSGTSIMYLNKLEIKFWHHRHIYHYRNTVSWPIAVECDSMSPFSIATTPRYCGGCYSISWITPLTYLIILSVKEGGIK